MLLDGVVTSRGRVWLATQPDEALWLESAGGGLRVGGAGRWLAAMTAGANRHRSPTGRRAMAALRWDERFGDRHTRWWCWCTRPTPPRSDAHVHWALVTDDELRRRASAAGRAVGRPVRRVARRPLREQRIRRLCERPNRERDSE